MLSRTRKTAAGFLVINKAYFGCGIKKQWRLPLTVTDTKFKHRDWFQGLSQDTYFKIR